MLTNIKIRNFKRLEDVEIELGQTVVLVGPNNSGKTSALQALVLWHVGLQEWLARREGRSPEKRSGVTVNRKSLIAVPVPDANLLWHNLYTRDVKRVSGKPVTRNIRIDITVQGVSSSETWSCGLEFDYANEESFYCRPLRLSEDKQPERMDVPPQAAEVHIAMLPPMSGLISTEDKLERGSIQRRIGEGRTAEVLRNLCYQIYEANGQTGAWDKLTTQIRAMFGAELLPPNYIAERGEITMAYKEQGITLDLSASGRGLQQAILLLAYLYANPKAVLLLDEPDAHLEILRQRQIYQLITEIADQQRSQIIAASHSEVILNEAGDRDVLIAFPSVGRPHRIDDRSQRSQILKALKDIGWEQYLQAEQTGWVLYLEGSTDLAILRAFAEVLGHEAAQFLERVFVHYVGNDVNEVRKHFWGLRDTKPDFEGIALFDRRDRPLPNDLGAQGLQWRRREIENYLALPETLLAYARHDLPNDLFGQAEADRRQTLMQELIADFVPPIALRDPTHVWWVNTKASDDFLDPLFESYFNRLKLPNLLRKTDYHVLARLVPKDKIDPEVAEKLDAIVALAQKAKPRTD